MKFKPGDLLTYATVYIEGGRRKESGEIILVLNLTPYQICDEDTMKCFNFTTQKYHVYDCNYKYWRKLS